MSLSGEFPCCFDVFLKIIKPRWKCCQNNDQKDRRQISKLVFFLASSLRFWPVVQNRFGVSDPKFVAKGFKPPQKPNILPSHGPACYLPSSPAQNPTKPVTNPTYPESSGPLPYPSYVPRTSITASYLLPVLCVVKHLVDQWVVLFVCTCGDALGHLFPVTELIAVDVREERGVADKGWVLWKVCIGTSS